MNFAYIYPGIVLRKPPTPGCHNKSLPQSRTVIKRSRIICVIGSIDSLQGSAGTSGSRGHYCHITFSLGYLPGKVGDIF